MALSSIETDHLNDVPPARRTAIARIARGGVAGAVAGAVATTLMTGFMFAAQRAGLLGKMPPKKITERVLDAFGADGLSKPTKVSATAIAHYGYGVGMGALFGAAMGLARRDPPPRGAGILFGEAVWLVSYAGWLPALGIMRKPKNDRPGRPTSMILAHAVFGFVLGESMRRLAGKSRQA